LTPALLLVVAYLVGAIPFGYLIAKHLAGIDVRGAGSGNIGATNVARTAGKGLGLLTLLLDALKGATPPLVAQWALQLSTRWIVAAGLVAVLGHVFPIFLGFKGGKGVATAAGAFLAISPLATLASIGAFAIVFAIGKVVSVGSLVASIALIVAVYLLDGRTEVLALAVTIAALVFVRHRGNIQRLLRGEESKLKTAPP
jgi:acyl phosphate:glycerol-3-phosphate acyltransferase